MYKRIIFTVKICFTLLLIVLIFNQIKLAEFVKLFTGIGIKFLLLSFTLMPLQIFLQTWRWHLLLNKNHVSSTFSQSLKSFLGGYALGSISPGRFGELGKSLFFGHGEIKRVLFLCFVERYYILLPIFVFGLAAMTIHVLIFPIPGKFYSVIGIGAFAILFLLILLPFAWFRKLVAGFVNKFNSNSSLGMWPGTDKMLFIKALGLSSIIHIILIIQFCILIRGINSDHLIFIKSAVGISQTFMLMSLLPVSFGNLGVRELSLAYFCTSMPMEGSVAVTGGILLFIINLLIPTLMGALPVILIKAQNSISSIS
ncbi:MAG: lysylphosphatidylglycerol synthase domain-containing protein [bacterium]